VTIQPDQSKGQYQTKRFHCFQADKLLDFDRRRPDAIDLPLKSMATDAELKRPGSGMECLLRELSKRGILSSRE
jgi:hypothetical protein